MTFGLTSAGFAAMTLADIRADLNARVWAAFGATLDLSDRSLEGQLVGIVAERLAALWELAEAVNSAMDIDAASGAALDALAMLTGTLRRGAAPSRVTLTLTGTPATTVPAGSIARVPDGVQFATDEAATLEVVSAWAATTPYVVGDVVENGGRVYVCVNAGTSAGSGGPVETEYLVEDDDGTVEWLYMGAGTAIANVPAAATLTGALVANAGTVTEIVTPAGGWSGAYNQADASVGSAQETDQDLRIRRALELAQPGTGTADAIRAALLAVADVRAVRVFVNNTDAVVDGMPPHSVEALVQGGDDQDLWDTLLANVAAGIQTHGTEGGTATDSAGVAHAVAFSRPVEIDVYVEISVLVDASLYPADGDDQIATAIATWGNARPTGWDPYASAVSAQAFTVPGVIAVTACTVDDVDPPVTTTVAVGPRELAVYDTARIEATSTGGTP
jgi:uncharacterized phage protein gp47/JayE